MFKVWQHQGSCELPQSLACPMLLANHWPTMSYSRVLLESGKITSRAGEVTPNMADPVEAMSKLEGKKSYWRTSANNLEFGTLSPATTPKGFHLGMSWNRPWYVFAHSASSEHNPPFCKGWEGAHKNAANIPHTNQWKQYVRSCDDNTSKLTTKNPGFVWGHVLHMFQRMLSTSLDGNSKTSRR